MNIGPHLDRVVPWELRRGPGCRSNGRWCSRSLVLDNSALLGGLSRSLLPLAEVAIAFARVGVVNDESRVGVAGLTTFALHILEREERTEFLEGDLGHEGDQVGGVLVLLGEAVEAVDQQLGIF